MRVQRFAAIARVSRQLAKPASSGANKSAQPSNEEQLLDMLLVEFPNGINNQTDEQVLAKFVKVSLVQHFGEKIIDLAQFSEMRQHIVAALQGQPASTQPLIKEIIEHVNSA